MVWPLAAALLLGAATAGAEDRPPASPVVPAQAPPAKPAGPGPDAGQPALAPPSAKPQDAPRPEKSAPAADGRPGAVGRLIPPGAPIPPGTDPVVCEGDADDDAAGVPAQPTGPPAHSLLREDDFAYAACRLELLQLGTVYTEEPPVTGEQRDCGIDRPLRVSAILPGITLEGGALMRCDTARALGWWVRDFVNPAARRLPGAPQLASMGLGSTYQCRGTVGASTSSLSEHSLGNAIDIASFTFDDHIVLPVEATGEGTALQAFLAAVRWSACMDFTTVLGPGSNAAHADHLHLDVKQRRGGYRVCE